MFLRHPEKQYLSLIRKIIQNGNIENGRNGKTYVSIGEMMRFSLKKNTIPLLTTKRVAWKTCLRELLWFVRGQTDNNILLKNNVTIWNDNATIGRHSSHGIFPKNDLGPIYGHQWRHFNAPYLSCKNDYSGEGVDQIQNIIDALKDEKERNSRRLILNAWNPLQLGQMALPPCHILAQFHVTNKKQLSCSLYQRSGDIGLGIPFNIASYSFLTHLLAHHCDLQAHEFIHFIGNAHIYDDHKEALQTQISRIPKPFPKITISNKYNTIEEYDVKDVAISDYTYHPSIKMKMRL